ncbi:MAG: hypothetical protein ACLU7V_00525 [Anaerovoracaceae bacterium]
MAAASFSDDEPKTAAEKQAMAKTMNMTAIAATIKVIDGLTGRLLSMKR